MEIQHRQPETKMRPRGLGLCDRLATDEHIEENDLRILLNRIDHTGRVAIKQ